MPINVSSEARFLGMDLQTLGREVRSAWAWALQSPLLSWVTPEATVLLHQADGGQSVWHAGKCLPNGVKPGKPGFQAIELPEDMLLRRSQALPPMDTDEIPHAAELQVRTLSPFAEADLVWGYGARVGKTSKMELDLVLASRKQVTQYIQSQAQRTGSTALEVWVLRPAAPPIVLKGYGENARRAHSLKGSWLRIALLALAVALLAAIAVTPSLQLRQRALDAYAAHQALARQAAPMQEQREALLQTVEALQALAQMHAQRIEPLRVLNKLTELLPDDTALQGFSLKGQKVSIHGQTANASTLMQILSQQEGMRDVRAPSAAVRSGGEARENFAIEFVVDAGVFGVTPAAPKEGKP